MEVFKALRRFYPWVQGQRVCVQTDNQAGKFYLNHQEGMGSQSLHLLSRKI